jgi:hypothetical protein
VLADFRARPHSPVALVADLKISKPYIFVTTEEREAFVATRPGPPLRNPPASLPSVPPRLEGVTHIITLYDVYFDKDRTLALTGIQNYCGPLCAKAQWKIYEKRNGAWSEVRPASMCMVIA